jgi:cytochrome c-type biogenesis protein
MSEFGLVQLFVLPTGLGLLGFIEPCSIGSSLLFIKFLERKSAATKLAETALFAATRAVLIGALGAAAVLIGGAFASFQQAAWTALGVLYAALGVLMLSGRAGRLMYALGPQIARPAGMRRSAALGLLFGLNIPACAAPLLAALLATAAAAGASGAALMAGFVSLAVFGFALSLPLVAAVFFARGRKLLDALARQAARFPKWAGIVLLVLGVWSIRYGLFVDVPLGAGVGSNPPLAQPSADHAARHGSDGAAEGEIRAVDKGAGMITIEHGPIANLGMPPLTMVFQVADPAMLDRVAAGDKVKFVADVVGDEFTVMRLEVAK